MTVETVPNGQIVGVDEVSVVIVEVVGGISIVVAEAETSIVVGVVETRVRRHRELIPQCL